MSVAGRALVLYNPTAGRGRGRLAAELAGTALSEAGWRVRPLQTRGHGDAGELVARFGAKAQRAVVVGGDGTLREVASSVLQAGHSLDLAFVPLGNANVVARALSIPLETRAAVTCAVSGVVRRVDVLQAAGHVALAMVGVGYDAQVTRRLAKARTGGWTRRWYAWNGDSLYGVIGGASLFEWNPARFRMVADDVPAPGRYAAAVISNLETYAKGWAMTPGADPADGVLDWMGRKRVTAPFGALSLACAALKKRGPRFLADYGQATRLVLEGEGPMHWQADGDYLGAASRLEIEVAPGAIGVVVPGDVY